MDSSLSSTLNYRIPGPAGNTFPLFPSSSSAALPHDEEIWRRGDPFDEVDRRLYTEGAWQDMLVAEKLEPFGTGKIWYSVNSLRKVVFNEGSGKAEQLWVRIMEIELIGKDGLVLLGDITGQICGTVHREVFEAREKAICVGSVLLLRGVTGLLCFDERRRLGRKLHGAYVHVSVQLSNIGRIFPCSSSAPPTHVVTSHEIQRLRDAYTDGALEIIDSHRESQMSVRRHLLGTRFLYQSARRQGRIMKPGRLVKSSHSERRNLLGRDGTKRGKGKKVTRTLCERPRSDFNCAQTHPVSLIGDTSNGLLPFVESQDSLCDDGLDDLFLNIDIEEAVAHSKTCREADSGEMKSP